VLLEFNGQPLAFSDEKVSSVRFGHIRTLSEFSCR
jgi:hypothetical protein